VPGYAIHIFSPEKGNVIFEPIKKINKNIYRCDKRYHIDSIIEMYEDEYKFGVAMLTGKEYRMYIITKSGIHIEPKLIASDGHEMQKQTKKGGQSAQRIGRIRENKQALYVKKLSEIMVNTYMNETNTKCIVDQGLIILGCGSIKNEVKKDKLFRQYFSDKIIATIDTPGINDKLIHDILSNDKYNDYFVPIHEKHDGIIKQISDDINIGNVDKLVFGYDNIIKLLDENQLICIVIYDKHIHKNKITQMIDENNSKCMIIPSNDHLIRTFDGCVGIKYFHDF
jgi:peptide chain release factor subunit 1